MGQEAKTAVEVIKIEDTCCRENICLIVMAVSPKQILE